MHIPEILCFLAVVTGLALVAGVFIGKVTIAAALDIGMLLAALMWLFFLVKIPWDLYFSARKARQDGQESERLGIQGVQPQIQLLRRLESRLWWGAVGAHLVTALAVYVIGVYSQDVVRPAFGWLFLGSVALRPAWEAYGYLRKRLAELAQQVRYPREDVALLLTRVKQQEEDLRSLGADIKALKEEMTTRFHQMDLVVQQVQSKEISDAARLEKRLVQLSHRFEEVVEKMSSDQELLAGIRAFARLFREQPPISD